MPITSIDNKTTVNVRTACGGHRFMLLDLAADQNIIELPLMPYKRNATADYYLKNIPEGTPRRKFEWRGNMEFGAFDAKCKVFEEILE